MILAAVIFVCGIACGVACMIMWALLAHASRLDDQAEAMQEAERNKHE